MLVATDLVKRYGGVTALAGAGIELTAGEIHALVGENGAGKSTLVKILSGAVRPDAGQITMAGRPVRLTRPADATAHGIAIVAQELSLFADLTVAENLFITAPPRRRGLVSLAAMRRAAAPVLADLGVTVPVTERLGTLPLADRQLIEISRALLADPRVLILDEPTSALAAPAVERLAGVLRTVAARGIAVLYISHVLAEIREIATRVTVLRDGRVALAGTDLTRLGLDDLITAMLGHPDPAARTRRPPPAITAPAGADPSGTGSAPPPGSRHPDLVLDRVRVPGRITGVSLRACPGEIVGLAGLDGAGHLTTLDVVCGLVRPTAGRVRLPGGAVPTSLRSAVANGVALVPGDRKRLGLMLDATVWENVASASWLGLGRGGPWLRRRALLARADRGLSGTSFRGDLLGRAGDLSGGNQQKVVFAKWMATDPTLVVLDDPTRGVDIGARAEMHDIIRAVAGSGRPVVITSTDLPELVDLCHRVLVFHGGRTVGELSGSEITATALATAMHAGGRQPPDRP